MTESSLRTSFDLKPNKRLLRYDILRALAAFVVIAYHFDVALPDYLNYANYPRPFMNGFGTRLFGGSLAVASFFILSGFSRTGALWLWSSTGSRGLGNA